MPVEKGNNWAGTACHGQRTDTNDTAAEKTEKDTGAVAEDTAPFVGHMPVTAMFHNPGNGIVWAETDIGTKVKGNAPTRGENTEGKKTDTAGYIQCFRKTDSGK